MCNSPFCKEIQLDCDGLLRCVRREGTPARVHFIELLIDVEVQQAICDRFGLLDDADPADPFYSQRRILATQRFLGYDYVRWSLDSMGMTLDERKTADTAKLARDGGRAFVDENTGPITNWDEFERYNWPDAERAPATSLDWFCEHMPDGMCLIGSGGFAHFAEHLTWLMGYETLCYALFDQRDLVAAISRKLIEINTTIARRLVQYDRVTMLWGADDMGHKTGTLISPDDLREFVLPGHKAVAEIAHAAGRPYLLHSCGNLGAVMGDLIDDVGIDARHSFEDVIEPVTEAHAKYGDRIALLGGIDMDFLCRASEEEIRRRVRETLDVCHPGGGYCLGSGNSIANYVPLDNYLAMLDEGRRFAG